MSPRATRLPPTIPAFRRDRQGGNEVRPPGRAGSRSVRRGTIHVGDEVVRYEGEELAQPATATIQRKRAVPAEAPAQPSLRKANALCRRYASLPRSRFEPCGNSRKRTGRHRSCPRSRGGAASGQGGNRAAISVPEHADDVGQPLSGVRRSMARNMERSRAEVAPATIHEEADVSAWVPGSDALHSSFAQFLPASRLSLHLTAGSASAKPQQELHLGVAVDIADGLVVPVLQDAGALDAGRLRSALNRLIEGARQRTLAPGDLVGATMTTTNYGMIAGLHATPVVIPPQIAILGSGHVGDRLRSGVDGPRVARSCRSLSYDHRCVTGGEAARFLRAVIASLETAD